MILLKRKKRERVACWSCYCVYTRWYVYQQTFFFQNFPPQPQLWKISGSAPVTVSNLTPSTPSYTFMQHCETFLCYRVFLFSNMAVLNLFWVIVRKLDGCLLAPLSNEFERKKSCLPWNIESLNISWSRYLTFSKRTNPFRMSTWAASFILSRWPLLLFLIDWGQKKQTLERRLYILLVIAFL